MGSKVLERLENAILEELDSPSDEFFDGWVMVDDRWPGRTETLGWSYRRSKIDVLNAFLRHAEHSCENGFRWADSFPIDRNRETQLRWLRRQGFRVKRALIKAID